MKAALFATLFATAAWTRCLASNETALRRRADEEDVHNFPFQSRIVGGSEADASNFEYSVYMGGCGGSLIWEDIVLTAAHCQELYPDRVRIGGNLKNNGERRDIVGTGTRHPRYSSRRQDYDFMVYKLGKPVTNLQPVVLGDQTNSPTTGDPLTVIGFGATFEGDDGSNFLQQVEVKYVSHSSCQQAYGDNVKENIMFCAGEEGKDSCQGDSGGPIVDANGVQVGVTSFGNGCAREGYPGVYARVSAVHGWLQERICEMSDNPPQGCGSEGGNSNPDIATEPPTEAPTAKGQPTTDNSDLVQPKGDSIRVDIKYDDYPGESAWVLYNDHTKEELHWSNYGDVSSPGLSSKTFTGLEPGRYVFLLLDSEYDGVCCQYGEGYVKVYELFSPESGRGKELRWMHDGQFQNAAGAAFWVLEEDDRRTLSQSIEMDATGVTDSPYLS